MKPDVLDGGIYGVRVEGQVEILELEMLSNESDILKRVTRAKRAGASYGCLSYTYINLYVVRSRTMIFCPF